MNETRSECAKALSNIGHSLDEARRFPRNVFRGQWSTYFFDSDRIFDGGFVEQVKGLLDIEGGVCACLINLDCTAEADRDDHVLFIERSTAPDIYRGLLRGAHPGRGWIHDMGRFACSSDLCQWLIYCERASEIAVIGIRSGASVERYAPLLSQLNAAQIAEAIGKPLSYGFSSEALSSQWRSELLKDYGRSSGI
jgi:hypothetical protein